MLNETNFQGHITPQARCILEASGRFKKHALSLPEGSVQQGRSHFCAQSVLPLREHGKMAKTPLAAFFNNPGYGSSWLAFTDEVVYSQSKCPVWQGD